MEGVILKKADQAILGTVSLPRMVQVKQSVYWFSAHLIKKEATGAAKADFVGLDEFISKLKAVWTDVDVIVATPSVMPKIGKLGKVLGPRNLMPNLKREQLPMM